MYGTKRFFRLDLICRSFDISGIDVVPCHDDTSCVILVRLADLNFIITQEVFVSP